MLLIFDIFSIYSWVVLFKDKRGNTITNAFQEILDEANCKTSEISVADGSKLYIRIMESWFQYDDIEMYSTCSRKKSAVAETFFRTLNKKSYKYMTSVSKNMYVEKLDNTYHSTIQTKPADVFVVKKVKNTVPWTYVISNPNGKGIVATFYEKEL